MRRVSSVEQGPRLQSEVGVLHGYVYKQRPWLSREGVNVYVVCVCVHVHVLACVGITVYVLVLMHMYVYM